MKNIFKHPVKISNIIKACAVCNGKNGYIAVDNQAFGKLDSLKGDIVLDTHAGFLLKQTAETELVVMKAVCDMRNIDIKFIFVCK